MPRVLLREGRAPEISHAASFPLLDVRDVAPAPRVLLHQPAPRSAEVRPVLARHPPEDNALRRVWRQHRLAIHEFDPAITCVPDDLRVVRCPGTVPALALPTSLLLSIRADLPGQATGVHRRVSVWR